jgi:hypothetical protein
MMCKLEPSASGCLSLQPLPHRRSFTTRGASTCHLVRRPHHVAQIHMMPVLGPRICCPLFEIDGTGRRALPFMNVLVRVRPNGILCSQCSLMTAALPPVVPAKSRIAYFWKPNCSSTVVDDPAMVEPFFLGTFTKCANAICRSSAKTCY